ncbi:hypothetical protein HYALB_00006923 [Hymenoscyphus albidus]|uniref:Hydroxyneurosporene synthase n=1 Tax=Hymenoscyphus albidus TaxID=595503 RepID=A0A9N9L9Z5_9HELO|nr:hypothetical protein HYALB_00006923 [Hymenoscyphus albidus]
MKLLSFFLSAIAVSAESTEFLPTPRDFWPWTNKTIPAQLATGNIEANFVSTKFGIDAPQLSAVNSTSFELWYFDAISDDSLSSVTVIFFASTETAFPLLSSPTITTSIVLNYLFPNGTRGYHELYAEEAVVETVGSGSVGTGISWKGSPDLSSYNITIDNPTIGIKGTINLITQSPAHYPCSPDEADQTMIVAPHIGWLNAVPDADAKVDRDINGSKLVFDGTGYHDKNWSDRPFNSSIKSWYWGRGRIGPYKIVWIDGVPVEGEEFFSAFASRDGLIMGSTCSFATLVVRPLESLYTPSLETSEPKGFSIVMDLGDEGILAANITAIRTLVDASPMYSRWGGCLAGAMNEGDELGGHGVYEQFIFV